ncbi:NAD(P)H-binding protein [Dactylosporangium sp. NPDC050688]|uniref:NAD(P)H-binding protein n=1 Tax=Dactylosporangium sp. NPDC050688 TaxID=3157217 RepID=UPI00340269B6
MILISGVSGALGGSIFDSLASRSGTPVRAGSRSGDGTAVRRVDFDTPSTLASAFRGVDVLVFVSAGPAAHDVAVARHGAVVEAAAAAGVRHVVYTSVTGSGDRLPGTSAHRWTEARLAAVPFSTTVLRNGPYAETAAALAAAGTRAAARTGVFTAALGHGPLPLVARRDLADVAARVAAESAADLAAGRRSRHAGATYDLAGVPAIGGDDIAGVLAWVLGRPVRYRAAPAARTAPSPAPGTVSWRMRPRRAGQAVQGRAGRDLIALLPTTPRPALDIVERAVTAVAGARCQDPASHH